jgi:uncharacterized protein YceH (UPF0502 family)
MEPLSFSELRVLGSLVEKELTTPERYPLTLNALTAACSQKSNRDPVVVFDEKVVVRALDALRERKLALLVSAAGARVPKYAHRLENLGIEERAAPVLAELMLRGPQTEGELRARLQRFESMAADLDLAAVLTELSERDPALVTLLPRLPGQKERRYVHCLGEMPDPPAEMPEPEPEAARMAVQQEEERFAALEDRVSRLEADLTVVLEEFRRFREQFE